MMEHSITFLLLTVLAFAVVLLIFGMKYFSAGRIARLRAANDTSYKELAEKIAAAQTANASALAAVREDLAEIKSVLGSVSRLLKEVQ